MQGLLGNPGFAPMQATGRLPPILECKPITREQTLPLRESVLGWPDMPITQLYLPKDDISSHYGAFTPGHEKPIGICTLFHEPLPEPHGLSLDQPPSKHARLRKFATDPAFRRLSVGSQLLKHAIKQARDELGCELLWCDARTTVADWYIKRGMIPFGEKFFVGTIEHIRVYMVLTDGE